MPSAVIHTLNGKLPPGAAALVNGVRHFHCSVCLGEIAVGLAQRKQSGAAFEAGRTRTLALFARLYPKQILTPSPTTWAAAGVVAGILARTQRLQDDQHTDFLNDALIFLTAAENGKPVLTANRRDFDLIQQIAPHGRFLHYLGVPP